MSDNLYDLGKIRNALFHLENVESEVAKTHYEIPNEVYALISNLRAELDAIEEELKDRVPPEEW